MHVDVDIHLWRSQRNICLVIFAIISYMEMRFPLQNMRIYTSRIVHDLDLIHIYNNPDLSPVGPLSPLVPLGPDGPAGPAPPRVPVAPCEPGDPWRPLGP